MTPFGASQQDANKKIRLLMYLRKMGVTDSNVLSAIEKVPREEFVPKEMLHQAWEDMQSTNPGLVRRLVEADRL